MAEVAGLARAPREGAALAAAAGSTADAMAAALRSCRWPADREAQNTAASKDSHPERVTSLPGIGGEVGKRHVMTPAAWPGSIAPLQNQGAATFDPE